MIMISTNHLICQPKMEAGLIIRIYGTSYEMLG